MKMQTFRKPHQWLNFWLEKYADALAGMKYSSEQRKKYWATLKIFLEELPGNPRNITLTAVESFISVNSAERLLPITLFYQHIAPSKPHCEMLKRLASSSGQDDDPIESFYASLTERDFSARTVKNYSSAVRTFQKWFKESPKSMTVDDIEKYCEYLSVEKKFSSRTIALHKAALKLFHQFVVDDASPSV